MTDRPDSLLGALAPIIEAAGPDDAPLLLAWLERLAADKYRGWAETAADEVERGGLLDCARREEDIAEFIEWLVPESATRMQALAARFPETPAIYDSVLEGHDRTEQLRRQAAGELGGAGFLREFAAAHGGAVAARFEALSCCEEANSRFLTVLIG